MPGGASKHIPQMAEFGRTRDNRHRTEAVIAILRLRPGDLTKAVDGGLTPER